MYALKKAFRSSFSAWLWDARVPEPESFCATPRPMTGFLATLSEDQKKLAREYRGDENHGDKAFAR